MKGIVAAVMMLGLISVAVADEPLTIKGLPLGATVEEIQKFYPKADCKIQTMCFLSARDAETAQSATIAGVMVPRWVFRLHEGKLEVVTMWPASAHFDRLVTAYRDHFGEPKSDESESIRTKAGVEYVNRTLVWDKPGGVIRLKRFGSNINESTLSYYTHDALSRQAEKVKADRKKAASDL